MNKFAWIGLLSVTSLAGCAATPHEEAASGSADIVGITDLSTLEQNLDLQRATPANPGDTAALQAGECYRALIATPSWQATYEFRRYANGAAFWAKLGSGYNSGDQRPVICVDLHRAEGSVSLSGAALDAVLRYDFGSFKGSDSGMGKTYLEFDRGAVLLSHYDVTDQERTASVQKRPHELPFENASTISGRILSLRIKNVKVEHMFGGEPGIEEMEMSGSVAQFIYRYAWHKNEETGRFTLAEDAIGGFTHTASDGADAGSAASSYIFARGIVTQSTQANFESQNAVTTDEQIGLSPPDPVPNRAPLAECVRTTAQNQAPPAFGCTGL